MSAGITLASNSSGEGTLFFLIYSAGSSFMCLRCRSKSKALDAQNFNALIALSSVPPLTRTDKVFLQPVFALSR